MLNVVQFQSSTSHILLISSNKYEIDDLFILILQINMRMLVVLFFSPNVESI